MIGEKIRAIRRFKGWTLEDLSERSGIAKSTIFNIEHERNGARFETIEWLLESMGYRLIIEKRETKNERHDKQRQSDRTSWS